MHESRGIGDEYKRPDQDHVKVIDVRTPEVYALICHREMAWNIPLGFITYQRKDGKL